MLAENYQMHRIGMLAVLALAMSSGSSAALADDADRIRPYCRKRLLLAIWGQAHVVARRLER